VRAPNLTPDPETGAGTCSDDQFAGAREGIGHNESTWFPLMPYEQYRAMSDEDPASNRRLSTIATPIRSSLPKTELILPVKYLIRNAPQPLTAPVPPPDLLSPVKRGESGANGGLRHLPYAATAWAIQCSHGVRRRLPVQRPSAHRYQRQHHSGSFRYSVLRREPFSRGDAHRKTPGSPPQRGYGDRRISKYDR
jgi:hypothetical protein